MRDVAVVAVARRQEAAIREESEVEMVAPVLEEARRGAGLGPDDIDFTCSGSSDFLAGQAFSFVGTLDATRPVPPIVESHVEMDGAWALYEAWVKILTGAADTALVYSYGRSSPGSLRDVLATQLDPYAVAPLWPDAHAVAGLQARLLLDAGDVTQHQMAEVAVRSLAAATANPHAVRSGNHTVEELLAAPEVQHPLRPHDIAARADGAAAVVLAVGDRARSLVERPVWIRAIDHRMDSHHLGARDLRSAPSAALAGARAGVAADRVDVAELDAPYTHQELVLVRALGLDPDTTALNPSGGSLCGHVMMAAGLVRLVEAAGALMAGQGDRAVAHATSGAGLQQNLVAVLEGD